MKYFLIKLDTKLIHEKTFVLPHLYKCGVWRLVHFEITEQWDETFMSPYYLISKQITHRKITSYPLMGFTFNYYYWGEIDFISFNYRHEFVVKMLPLFFEFAIHSFRLNVYLQDVKKIASKSLMNVFLNKIVRKFVKRFVNQTNS